MDPMLAFALPGGALAFGAVVFALHKLSMWRFNRKHPNLRRGADRTEVAEVSLKAVAAAAASTEMLDEIRIEAAVTANQSARQSAIRPSGVFDTLVTVETVETLKRAGLVVSSVPVGTFSGQVRGHSNILPPRPSRPGPRSRRGEGATATEGDGVVS